MDSEEETTEKIVVFSMGAMISKSSSPTKDTDNNMKQKRSITSADYYDYKSFGLSEDLENWMKNLPAKLKAKPIIFLAIPGKYIERNKKKHKIYLLLILSVFQ